MFRRLLGLFVLFFATSSLCVVIPPPCSAQVLRGYSATDDRALRPRVITLQGTGFGIPPHEDTVYQMYLASLHPTSYTPSKEQVRAAIATIAADTDRAATISFSTGFIPESPSRTRAKIDTRTGDFLVVDSQGRVAAFTRLPLDRRALGKTADLNEFAAILSSYTANGSHSHPRFYAGEDLGFAQFSPHNRSSHFNKHVLACPSGMPLRRWLDYYKSDRLSRFSSFPSLQEFFARALSQTNFRPSLVDPIYKDFLFEYEKRAKLFLRSTSATALSSTHLQRVGRLESVITFKFDLQTLEFAIVNRRDQTLITYFRVTDMVPSNDHLHYRIRVPAVETPLEYFLVMALSSHDRH